MRKIDKKRTMTKFELPDNVSHVVVAIALNALVFVSPSAYAEMTYTLGIHNDTDFQIFVYVRTTHLNQAVHCTVLEGGEQHHTLGPKSKTEVKFRRHGGRCDGKQGHLRISAVTDRNEHDAGGHGDYQYFWYSNSGSFSKHGQKSKYESTLKGRGAKYELHIQKVVDSATGHLAAAPRAKPEIRATLQHPQFRLSSNGRLVSFDVMGYLQNAEGHEAKVSLEFYVHSDSGWIPLSVNPNYRDSQQVPADTQRFQPVQSESHRLNISNMTIPSGALGLQPQHTYRLKVLAALSVGNVLEKSPPVEFDLRVY